MDITVNPLVPKTLQRVYICRWMEQYKLASCGQERMWLYHELGTVHLNMEQHDIALEWADQLYLLSISEHDQTWTVYAVVLMAKTEGNSRVLMSFKFFLITLSAGKEHNIALQTPVFGIYFSSRDNIKFQI